MNQTYFYHIKNRKTMTKKMLLLSATLGMAYLGFTGFSSGPGAGSGGLNLTGSPGSTGSSCGGSGCHASGSGAITTGVAIRKVGAGLPVTDGKYEPGASYDVTLTGANTLHPTPTLPKFGFQITATKADGTKAGTVGTPLPTSTARRTIGGLEIVEHTAALNQGTLPGSYLVTFRWTAPPVGSGNVTFSYIVNGVNGTSTASGDQPSISRTTVFSEQTASINELNASIANKVFPNPCSIVLNIDAPSNTKYVASVHDLVGRQILAPSHSNQIDVSTLNTGVYVLRLVGEEGQQSITFVKQ
jgi:hypothetical protein